MLNMNNEEALAVIFANSYDALIPEMVSERLMACRSLQTLRFPDFKHGT